MRNLTTVPPGGWRLTQTLPDGTEKKWASMNEVWALAEQIADFRKGNGLERATVRDALHDIEEATCTRIHDDPEYCTASEADKKKGEVRSARLLRSAGLVRSGATVLVEWLGDGAVPVPITQAQARANVCLTCPENREGHKWLKLTASIVRTIAEQMQVKAEMKLRVVGEERLHSCRICLCPLALKVHVPLPTILEHTDDETLAAFPPHCWLVTEQQTQSL